MVSGMIPLALRISNLTIFFQKEQRSTLADVFPRLE